MAKDNIYIINYNIGACILSPLDKIYVMKCVLSLLEVKDTWFRSFILGGRLWGP